MEIPKQLKKPRKVDTSKIVVRKSKVHGAGVFAVCDIKKGEKVVEYVGNIVTKKEWGRTNVIELTERLRGRDDDHEH